MRMLRIVAWIVAIAASAGTANAGGGTAFTYQGALTDAGELANGLFDFEFELWDAAMGGSQIGSTQIHNGVTVADGLFLILLDFGADAFDNADRWLAVTVNTVPLSPRQPVTRVPYAIQTRGIFVDQDQNIGIGTTTPDYPLEVETNSANAIYATTSGESGRGVYGLATAVNGSNFGVFGESVSSGGGGVKGVGHNTGVSGQALGLFTASVGVFGRSDSPTGRGLQGQANATTGDAYGVLGNSESTSGRGVYGRAAASSGTTYGVYGRSDSTSGNGVYGEAFANSGTNYGVYGLSHSDQGRGVYGTALKYGVFGQSDSTSFGYGVFGFASASSGINYGVFGSTNSPIGYGEFSFGNYGGTGAKYFIQPHPYDPSKEIRFVCLEGNESGTYFRGSTQLVDGRAVIDVPEEFRLVSEFDGLTVQVTAMGPNAGLWVETKNLDEIVVRGSSNVKFDYFVNGVRRGFANLELIRENQAYVPQTRGAPYGTQLRPAHRQILVENGILNPDFTPNEATAAMMGWTLRDLEPEDQPTQESKPNSGGTK